MVLRAIDHFVLLSSNFNRTRVAGASRGRDATLHGVVFDILVWPDIAPQLYGADRTGRVSENIILHCAGVVIKQLR
jgi:hypothetical protein